ncbi:MAG: Hsp20/alpha crystallin family protein [Phycisphaerales bacterium JB059]
MTDQIITRREAPRALLPVDRIFENFFREPFFMPVFSARNDTLFDEGALAVDISEDDENVILRASLPGVNKDDVDIEVHDGAVTINARKSEQREERAERYYRRERREGALSRRVTLPVAVVEDEASAELTDGELTLRLPKSPKDRPRKVSIS